MPMDFPSSPTVGQQYNGYVWTGTAWDSTSAQPIAVTTVASGDNAIINGGFDIWQRGTSFTGSNQYVADRWAAILTSAATVSRQTSTLPGFSFCLRFQRNSGSTSTTDLLLEQPLETANSLGFAGKTITFSFYARAGANYSATSSILNATLYSGTGTDQNRLYSGYTGSATVVTQNFTLTTSWQRFTATGVVPSNATELSLSFLGKPTGTAGANDWFEIDGVQLEEGAAATAFRRNAPSIQGELAACQRYYYRMTAIGNQGINFAYGIQYGSLIGVLDFKFPVTMRSAPASLDWTNSTSDYTLRSGAATYALTGNLTLANDSDGRPTPYLATVFAPCTSASNNTPLRLVSTTANAFIGFSAEL